MEIIREKFEDDTYVYTPLSDHIVRAFGICGGRPTFKYTRIEIAGALDRLAGGESVDDLVAGYGGRVTRESILEAIDIAARHLIANLPDLAA